MSKVTITIDADKADLIAQYTWAISRLATIQSDMDTVNTTTINTLAKAQIAIRSEASAIKDEAIILKKIAVILKKLVMHELN